MITVKEVEKMINANELIAYCKKCADVNQDLAKKSLENIGKGESETSALGAYAYFMQQEQMFRFTIPNLIQGFLDEKQQEDKKDPLVSQKKQKEIAHYVEGILNASEKALESFGITHIDLGFVANPDVPLIVPCEREHLKKLFGEVFSSLSDLNFSEYEEEESLELIGKLIDVLEDWLTDLEFTSHEEVYLECEKYDLLSEEFREILGMKDKTNVPSSKEEDAIVDELLMFVQEWIGDLWYQSILKESYQDLGFWLNNCDGYSIPVIRKPATKLPKYDRLRKSYSYLLSQYPLKDRENKESLLKEIRSTTKVWFFGVTNCHLYDSITPFFEGDFGKEFMEGVRKILKGDSKEEEAVDRLLSQVQSFLFVSGCLSDVKCPYEDLGFSCDHRGSHYTFRIVSRDFSELHGYDSLKRLFHDICSRYLSMYHMTENAWNHFLGELVDETRLWFFGICKATDFGFALSVFDPQRSENLMKSFREELEKDRYEYRF